MLVVLKATHTTVNWLKQLSQGVDSKVDKESLEMYLENCDEKNECTPVLEKLNPTSYLVTYDLEEIGLLFICSEQFYGNI